MKTKKQEKREQRRRDKEARRRYRQEAERKRQHPRQAPISAEDMLRQLEASEARERTRQNRIYILGAAAALLAMASDRERNAP